MLERFHAGAFTVPAGVVRSGDDFERPVRCPVPVYVVETATERILVDTGLSPGGVADPAARYGNPDAFGPFRAEQDASIADLIDLSTLTMVVLTHLHFDHAGGLDLVPPSVPLVVQRAEWEAGHDTDGVARNFFLPRDYAGIERELRLVDGDHDLLGDGSIELISTPGHTPGHQSVRVGDVVIGADVTHFASGLDDLRLPVFGDDLAVQASSAERLRGLRDAGATVTPGHDPDALAPGPIALSSRPSPDDLRLRPATAADVPRLTAIVQAAYGHYVERIGQPPRPVVDDYAEIVRSRAVTVAEHREEVVGLVVLTTDDEGFLVDNVAVDPAHQGTGVGKALLQHAEREARRAGFDSAYLYTHETMTENLAMYARAGYVEYDRRPLGERYRVYLRKQLG